MSSSTVEQIKSRLDIVSFIGSYIKLDKAGANFKARCPFHSEKTPSFSVSPSREIWHCFGCGRGGDAFKFIMELENIEFPEALRILAERTGVEIKAENPKVRSERIKLLALLQEAADYYKNNLSSVPEVVDYLKERGITGETARDFKMGYAGEGWRNLINHLAEKGYSLSEIEKVGLAIKKRNIGTVGDSSEGQYYDRFRERIIFPLIDNGGRIIGFGGRIFKSKTALRDSNTNANAGQKTDEPAKYINSPQTIFYDKSKFLYGFFESKEHIRKASNTIIVEGYMDVILSHQTGVKNVVAVSGTSLTKDHIRMIKRFSEDVTFAFDMDEAGVSASRRSAKLASSEGLNVKIIELPHGKDPADIASVSADAWKKSVTNVSEYVEFFLSRAIEKYSLKDGISKRKIGADVLPIIASLSSDMERAHWVGELARKLSIPEDSCWKDLSRYLQKDSYLKQEVADSEINIEEKVEMDRKSRLERNILGFILWKPELINGVERLPDKNECSLPNVGSIFYDLTKIKKTVIKRNDLISKLSPDDREFANSVLFEIEQIADMFEDIGSELSICLKAWDEENIRSKMRQLQIKLRETEALGDEKKQSIILKEIFTLTSQKK